MCLCYVKGQICVFQVCLTTRSFSSEMRRWFSVQVPWWFLVELQQSQYEDTHMRCVTTLLKLHIDLDLQLLQCK